MRYQLPFDAKALAIFVAVVEQQSMSAAALQFNMSQSAVSQAIQQLEKELSVSLLDRSVRPICATSTGVQLYQKASTWLSEMNTLKSQIYQAKNNKLPLLRLGLVDSFATTAGPALIKELAQRTNHLRVTSGVSPSLWEAISKRELDLAITMPPATSITGIETHPLLQESYLIALPRIVSARFTHWRDLVGELPFIRYSRYTPSGIDADGYLNWLRLQPDSGLEFDSADTLLSMVASGLGWTMTTPLCLLQARAYLDDIECIPLSPPVAKRSLVIMFRAGELDKFSTEVAHLSQHILQTESFIEISKKVTWLTEHEFSLKLT